jgi:hypothetical protein
MDLHSTFFGTSINDEIERRLFGDIDARGSKAIRAFVATDVGEWHRQFQTLFEYIDIQKIRTPKRLDWLKTQYPTLTQNDLMLEMQGIPPGISKDSPSLPDRHAVGRARSS